MSISMRVGWVVALCWAVLVCAPALAAPNLINYQGVLTDNLGAPVTNVSQPMTFRLYDAETVGNLLWEEPRTVDVQNGHSHLSGFLNHLFGFFQSWFIIATVIGERGKVLEHDFVVIGELVGLDEIAPTDFRAVHA